MIYIVAAVAFVILILIIALQAARASAKQAKSELSVQKTVNAAVVAESETLKAVEHNLHQLREQHRVETIQEQSHVNRDAFESDWLPAGTGYVAPNSGATATHSASTANNQS